MRLVVLIYNSNCPMLVSVFKAAAFLCMSSVQLGLLSVSSAIKWQAAVSRPEGEQNLTPVNPVYAD